MPSPGPHADVPVPAREPDSSSRSGRRVDTTPLVREPPMATTPAGDADEARSAGSMATPTLEVVEGSGAGRVVPIDREVFVIGRVGLQVAAAMRTPDGLRLVHVEGDTPPRINGAALPGRGLAAGARRRDRDRGSAAAVSSGALMPPARRVAQRSLTTATRHRPIDCFVERNDRV